ncbi:MAG: NeuD/PglB/VioB family sugar acetyltransferase [Bacillota bacterium]
MILYIFGSGGFGKDVLEIAKQINKVDNKWNDIVFFVDDGYKTQETVNDIKVLEFKQFLIKYYTEKADVIIAVGEPSLRKLKWNLLTEHKVSLTKIVHPSVYIPESTIIEEGVIIGKNAMIASNSLIRFNSVIQPMASLGHDCIINCHSVISTFCSIGGGCEVGEASFFGLNSSLRENKSVGVNSIVSMGAIVQNNISENMIVMGNPARVIAKNDKNTVFK